MTMRKSIGSLFVGFFCALLPASAQDARGTLLGRVTDPTGAVIVGAKVEAANTVTGVRLASTTNGRGDYIVPFLIPGPYSITVQNAGFKNYTRTGIVVRVNDEVAINVTMQLGEASETVNVSAESPILDTSAASMGQVVDSRTILDLPLKDGMVLTLATITPGVSFTPSSAGYVRPFDTASPSAMTIDGTRSGSNQFMMDGAPNMQSTEVAYSPPPGVVEEFKVQSASFDASTGFMGGASINMSLKSGTNQVHGQVYYFMQNPVLNANTFMLNRIGQAKAGFRLHRWGGSASGPVHLPKLYDGRNRTFWMYGYEGIWSFDPSPWVVEAVPTPAQRAGNLSGLLALGSQYQIYDPYSIAPATSGRFSRQPLAGNLVPSNMINPVSAKIAALWDLPNRTGTSDGQNNYTKGKNAQDTYWNHIVRIDHNLSPKQRLYVRTNFTSMLRPQDVRHNKAVGATVNRLNRGFAVDHVYVASPGFFINTRYTLTRFIKGVTPFQSGWDLAGLGFSPTFVNQINQADPRALKLPNIAVGGGISSLGGVQSRSNRADNIHEVAGNATTIAGAHTLRYGVAYRVNQENNFDLGNSSGAFTFDTTWTRGPLDNSPSSPTSTGQGMAAFLYGLPGSASFPINDSYADTATVLALFVQDDWKVSRKLTLSVGLRYERPSPVTERFNRSVRNFDATVASPIQAQVLQNYARNPIPQIPVSQFKVLGGLTFAGVGGNPRTLWKTNQNEFMPRVGFAYSMTSKTVLRGGYGVFYDALGVVSVNVNQTGFTQSTDMVPSVNNGQAFIATLTNPFPGGFLPPLGAAGGLSTYLGQGISSFDENTSPSYMQRWQLAMQRQLPKNSLIEVSYVGNRGTRMQVGTDLNPTPRQYYSTLPVRDQAAIDLLSAAVSNPFYPLLPKTGLASTTVARSQLLKPYPQFTGVSAATNSGYSWYHSMQMRFERRFSAGLSSSLAYTWSKMMEATSYLNPTDIRPEEVISNQDRTHRLAVTMLYELPFGRQKRWGGSANKALSKMIGGWQFQGIYTAQSGAALGFGNVIFNGNLKDIPLPKDQRNADNWFNVNAGWERNTAKQLGSNIRTMPSRFSGVRADGPNNWDLSMIKNTQLRESVRLQFRAEAMNLMNHPQFTAPNTTVTSTAFGTVTGEFAWARVVQFGLKILF